MGSRSLQEVVVRRFAVLIFRVIFLHNKSCCATICHFRAACCVSSLKKKQTIYNRICSLRQKHAPAILSWVCDTLPETAHPRLPRQLHHHHHHHASSSARICRNSMHCSLMPNAFTQTISGIWKLCAMMRLAVLDWWRFIAPRRRCFRTPASSHGLSF